MIKEYLHRILAGENLSMSEAAAAMDQIMGGHATPAQIAALVVGLKLKGETAEEVEGFVRSMRKHAVAVKAADQNVVDGVGTGGDGAHTFNISTAAALVTAASGVHVAKHGNRSVSSKCGSADLLEATGGNIDPGPAVVEQNINQIGFGFMFAPRFHPAMKHAAGPRRELGVRTVFNILGPMTNPAGVKRQVTGVYDRSLMPLFATVLEHTGSEHVLIVHSRDGLDEFSVSAPTDFVEVLNGKRTQGTLSPEEVGLKSYPMGTLVGAGPDRNLEILNEVLKGERSGCREAVLLNAGAMIYVGGKAESIADGVEMAARSIDSGAVEDKLNQWIKASQA